MMPTDPLLSKSSWSYKKILSLPPQIGACNTDVTKGPDGKHVMVLEMMVYMDGGQGYRSLFAETGADLSQGWTLMDPATFFYSGGAFGHATLGTYDYGDPTIRYLPSDGYYCKRDPPPRRACLSRWLSVALSGVPHVERRYRAGD